MNKKKKETQEELLKEILLRLNSIDPPVRKIAVNSPDPAMTMYFLDLEDVCYIVLDRKVQEFFKEYI